MAYCTASRRIFTCPAPGRRAGTLASGLIRLSPVRRLGPTPPGGTPRRGFTLIELLVVIGIVAVLAAILFPVLLSARAHARQAACASNLKQQGLAIMQYVQDYDEVMPQALIRSAVTGNWAPQRTLYATPPESHAGLSAYQTAYARSTWANAVQPYIHDLTTLTCPDSQPSAYAATPVAPGAAPPHVSYTFNGDLQMYPVAQMPAPSDVILLWDGHQRNAWVGYSDANPQLACPNKDEGCTYLPPAMPVTPAQWTQGGRARCQTDPAGNPRNGAVDKLLVYSGQPNYTKWVHGEGDNFLYADGHVQWASLHEDPWVDPYRTGDGHGSVLNAQGQYAAYDDGCHSLLFRPDYLSGS